MKLIFAVLYVSWTMGLTLVIKRKFFNIYICSFSTIFHAISIRDTCLRNLFPNQISIKYLNPWPRWATSGLGKRTAAILDFHFRFLFWHMRSLRCVILHLSSKFRRDRKIHGWVMSSYRFFKMGHTVGNVLPVSGLVTASVQDGGNLFACRISTRYINPRLR